VVRRLREIAAQRDKDILAASGEGEEPAEQRSDKVA